MISSDLQEQELEIIKAVAQAWLSHSHSHSNFLNQANEFDTRISTKFKTRPSRFKAEAKTLRRGGGSRPGYWDFNQSLWDPYEIVAVSKRLDDGMLVPDQEFLDPYCSRKSKKTRRESKNSLRSLFSQLALSTFDGLS
ncbi:unnamed protein product [Rhodiola kirilowii]